MADDDVAALDVALNDAVDLDFAFANKIADDGEVGANNRDGLRAIAGGGGGPSETGAAERRGRGLSR